MTDLEKEQRFKRLPKWAQDEFRRLANRAETAEYQRDIAFGRTKTNVGCYVEGVPLYLSEHHPVRFRVPLGYFDVRYVHDKQPYISVIGQSIGTMVVLPRASNHIHIEFAK